MLLYDKIKKLNDNIFKGFINPKDAIIRDEYLTYVLCIGKRNNGKTFGYKLMGLYLYLEYGQPFVIMRRYAESIKAGKSRDSFSKIFNMKKLRRYSAFKKLNDYDGIKFVSGAYYFYKLDEKKKKILESQPFCVVTALNQGEIDKSVFDIENLSMVLFDEFLTRYGYLQDEFITFMNKISTLIRNNDKCVVVMCANTVTFDAPYFREMGITNIRHQREGSIQTYEYSGIVRQGVESHGKIVCYLCTDNVEGDKKETPVDKFFAFGSPASQMITAGRWEVARYPRIKFDLYEKMRHRKEPIKLLTRDCYIKYKDDILCLEVYAGDVEGLFVLVRPYYSELDFDKIICVWTNEHIFNKKAFLRIRNDRKIDKIIWTLYVKNRFYYADNMTGEILRNYLLECTSIKPNE